MFLSPPSATWCSRMMNALSCLERWNSCSTLASEAAGGSIWAVDDAAIMREEVAEDGGTHNSGWQAVSMVFLFFSISMAFLFQ
ncbi:glutamate synthase subunit alpha [Sesbania bispinosa]|nr:glutamate synthase subunit alpha [Sesbania bispinosa]